MPANQPVQSRPATANAATAPVRGVELGSGLLCIVICDERRTGLRPLKEGAPPACSGSALIFLARLGAISVGNEEGSVPRDCVSSGRLRRDRKAEARAGPARAAARPRREPP